MSRGAMLLIMLLAFGGCGEPFEVEIGRDCSIEGRQQCELIADLPGFLITECRAGRVVVIDQCAERCQWDDAEGLAWCADPELEGGR